MAILVKDLFVYVILQRSVKEDCYSPKCINIKGIDALTNSEGLQIAGVTFFS